MIEKTLAKCGFCGYVWTLKLENRVPKMCPTCKKRFKNSEGAPPWATKEVKLWKEKFSDSSELRNRLEELNKARSG